MKAKELMIGDWVQIVEPCKYAGAIGRIKTLIDHKDDENAYFKVFLQNNTIHIGIEDICSEDIRPIPLTPEILEKNGWIKTKYAYGRDCMEIHGTDELPEGVDNALSMARWSIDKNFQYHFLDLYMWKGSVMKHGVHYVHQLQQAMRIMGCDKEIEL